LQGDRIEFFYTTYDVTVSPHLPLNTRAITRGSSFAFWFRLMALSFFDSVLNFASIVIHVACVVQNLTEIYWRIVYNIS